MEEHDQDLEDAEAGDGDLEERIQGPAANDEIGMLVQALNQAFDRYQDALCRLDRFAGYAAHQLRTPLTSMRSIGEICLQRDRDPDAYRECIRGMLEVVEELTDVVEKMLVLARLNTSRIRQDFQVLSPADEVRQVAEVFLPAIQDKDIRLDLQLDDAVAGHGDPGLIRQALGNLLDNAIRVTPKGGRIRLTVAREGADLCIAVDDSGPPFPAHLREQLQRSGPSAGVLADRLPFGRMGLALVAEVMRIHEGRIGFSPEQDGMKGLRLIWPLAGRPHAPAPAAIPPGEQLAPARA